MENLLETAHSHVHVSLVMCHILNLSPSTQCPRSQEEGYVGEILLGIKWSPVIDDNTGIKSEDGQLQVYVVEGAGMVDEDTHKPFNAFIKW